MSFDVDGRFDGERSVICAKPAANYANGSGSGAEGGEGGSGKQEWSFRGRLKVLGGWF